jgi:hypothetical protein
VALEGVGDASIAQLFPLQSSTNVPFPAPVAVHDLAVEHETLLRTLEGTPGGLGAF